MADVSLRNVKKIYDKNVVAVQEFNLEIADKEFVVFVGPSGCGKSTTLRMIAGLEEISEGQISIGETVVNDLPPKDRDIAMVFQNYALYPHMSVYENMAFALKMKKVPKDVIKEKVEEAAKILDITQYLERKPKALSGGQRQRVAIGRAIVRDPQVFLMDEPLSNLDAKLRNQMRAELIKLRKKINTTFIYVTHDQTEAMTLGDRIVIMKDGFIQQIGTPQEVYNHPATLFVAGFIGSPQMNVMNASLKTDGKTYFVELDRLELALPEEVSRKLAEKNTGEREIKLGIRPEHISLVAPGTPGSLKAKVVVSELMGSEVFLHISTCCETCEAIVKVSTVHNSAVVEGCDAVDYCMPVEFLHLFDPESGKNLLVD